MSTRAKQLLNDARRWFLSDDQQKAEDLAHEAVREVVAGLTQAATSIVQGIIDRRGIRWVTRAIYYRERVRQMLVDFPPNSEPFRKRRRALRRLNRAQRRMRHWTAKAKAAPPVPMVIPDGTVSYIDPCKIMEMCVVQGLVTRG